MVTNIALKLKSSRKYRLFGPPNVEKGALNSINKLLNWLIVYRTVQIRARSLKC